MIPTLECTIRPILSDQCPSLEPLFPSLQEGRMSGGMIESKGHWWQTIPGQRSRKRRNVILSKEIFTFKFSQINKVSKPGEDMLEWIDPLDIFHSAVQKLEIPQLRCAAAFLARHPLAVHHYHQTVVKIFLLQNNEQYVSKCESRKSHNIILDPFKTGNFIF